MRKLKKRGLSIIELLIALAIASIMIGVAISFTSSIVKDVKNNRDLAFASKKITQIINELTNYVESGTEHSAGALDKFNEPKPSPVLTTANVSPDNPLSGNIPGNGPGKWYYYKQIIVQPLDNPRDIHARLVTVKIYRTDLKGNLHELLSATTVIRSLIDATPPKQVYDIYLLSISSTPGW